MKGIVSETQGNFCSPFLKGDKISSLKKGNIRYLPSLKIFLRHIFWTALILSDNSREVPGCQTGQAYSRVGRTSDRKILKQCDLGHLNFLRSLRRENAAFARFKVSLI